MTAWQHLRAALCLAGITLNLIFWGLALLVLLPAKAAPGTRPWFRRVAARIYRAAVRVDNVLLRRISRASWHARAPVRRVPAPNACGLRRPAAGRGTALHLDPERPHIVLSNHRSWADIFLVQDLVAARGPIVTFLTKRELVYVPIFGLIVLAFDFPVLRRRTPRGGDAASRRADDRRRVTEASAALLDSPAAILSFAEGTRFTPAKRDAAKRDAARRDGAGRDPVRRDADARGTDGAAARDPARPNVGKRDASRHAARDRPYRHLLRPRAGGLTAMIEALAPGGGSIVDVTLVYPRSATFWEFLGGAVGPVQVAWETIPIATVKPGEVRDWLNDRWRRKDELLHRSLGERTKICTT